jgi:hypothetical protein
LYPIDKIFESIELEIGGSTIDRIHGSCYDVMINIYNLSHTITKINDDLFYYTLPIPIAPMIDGCIYGTAYHCQDIYIKLKDTDIKKINCLYDRYSTPLNRDGFYMPMRQLNYKTNVYLHIDSNISNFDIRFTSRSTLLFFSFEDNNKQIIQENIIDKLELVFDNKTIQELTFNIIDDIPGFYFIPIARVIKFCKIMEPILKIYHKANILMDLYINAYSIELNELRYVGGMCGKSYLE